MLLTCYFFFSLTQVVIPLSQLKAVNPSTSKAKPAEKYIQVISVDNHEFWFMGFVHYDSAVKNLLGALGPHSLWCDWGQIIWPCHGESHSPIVSVDNNNACHCKICPKKCIPSEMPCEMAFMEWIATLYNFQITFCSQHHERHIMGCIS